MKRHAPDILEHESKRINVDSPFVASFGRGFPGNRRSFSDVVQNAEDDSGYLACRVHMKWNTTYMRVLAEVIEDSRTMPKVEFDVQDEFLLAMRGFSIKEKIPTLEGLQYSVIITYSCGTLLKFTKRSQPGLPVDHIIDTRSVLPEEQELDLHAEDWCEPSFTTLGPPHLPHSSHSKRQILAPAFSVPLPSNISPAQTKSRKNRHKDRKRKERKSENHASSMPPNSTATETSNVVSITHNDSSVTATTREVPQTLQLGPPSASSSSKSVSVSRVLDSDCVSSRTVPPHLVRAAPSSHSSTISEFHQIPPVSDSKEDADRCAKYLLTGTASSINQPCSSTSSLVASTSTSTQTENVDWSLNIIAGGTYGGWHYTPLNQLQHGIQYRVAGVVVSTRDIKQTRNGKFARSFRLADPSSPEQVTVNCFTPQFTQWLPPVKEGDVIILVDVRGDVYKKDVGDVSLTGAENTSKWAILSFTRNAFHHGKIPANVPWEQSTFSPFYVPNQAETGYCRRLADWWDALQTKKNVVQKIAEEFGRVGNARKHRLLKDAKHDEYSDITVEVLYRLASHRNDIHLLYVTDYTKNDDFPGWKPHWCPEGLERSVLAIEMSDKALDLVSTLETNRFYSIENVRVRVSGLDGNLEGKLREAKVQQLNVEDTSYDTNLKALLERRAEWMKKYAPGKLVPSKPSQINTPRSPGFTIKRMKALGRCPDTSSLSAKVVDIYPHSLLDALRRFCTRCDSEIQGLQKLCSRCKDSQQQIRFAYELELIIRDSQGDTLPVRMSDRYNQGQSSDCPLLRDLKHMDLKGRDTHARFSDMFDSFAGNAQEFFAGCAATLDTPFRRMTIRCVEDPGCDGGKAYYLWNVEEF
ncbi:hypothetical protein D9758_003722 [Tetrapyrgos nigripes]|uniref:Protection of telomeres protein 1 n=1 Tax=Tetrapyrgos nigripes TaxID=182062 RepID=A0A8H5GMI5_9AGAR|nr:hypothetical protein D9758_003722 [Tetrapyrgos nigripes]